MKAKPPKTADRLTPTIREVAKLANVGLMTVSRVINDHPSVKAKTKKKVLAAISALGYQRNEAASLLKGQRAKTIGLIVPDLSDIFFASCAHTVQQVARDYGYATQIVSSERDAELEYEQAELMARRRLAGLLIVSSAKDKGERLKKVQTMGLPIVAFDRPLDSALVDAVLVENRAGAEAAVQHLIDHGHRKIACIGYDDDVYPVAERIAGYSNLLRTRGLEPDIQLGIRTLDSARKWLESRLYRDDKPSAIFSLNYRTSVFLLRAFSELKIKVPTDVAIIGFDDFDLASVVAPPLTTVGQSPVDLASRAVGILIGRMQTNVPNQQFGPAKILLPATLIIRESCGVHSRVAIGQKVSK